ncbi:MAG TPA: YceK/YidQ family lipoprotein [Verrucomicrobiae bacterium]|nr:YceK/YidQ family lipoprotein [Verrucomicrobiae bacterium]
MAKPLLAGAIVFPGCSTMQTAVDEATNTYQCDGRCRVPRVYAGVANDMRQMRHGGEDWPVEVYDLPFSFAADTVLLPVTIVTQSLYGDLCPGPAAR